MELYCQYKITCKIMHVLTTIKVYSFCRTKIAKVKLSWIKLTGDLNVSRRAGPTSHPVRRFIMRNVTLSNEAESEGREVMELGSLFQKYDAAIVEEFW